MHFQFQFILKMHMGSLTAIIPIADQFYLLNEMPKIVPITAP
jgi:hypothetical protein